ncbi:hypothetical protein [Sphingomonas koreensis]
MFALALTLMAQTAPSPADIADARCLLAISWLAEQQKDEVAQLKMTAGIMFFTGKLAGRGAIESLPAAIAALEEKEPEPNFAAIAEPCAEQMVKASAGMAK